MIGIEFKGWEIQLQDLESMVELCKATGTRNIAFGVGCMERDEVTGFIDPNGGEYKCGQYKLFARGCIIKPTGMLCSFPLTPLVKYFDEFPPIPPEPITEEPE